MPRFIFTLTSYITFFERQKGQVIVFDEKGIRVFHKEKVLHEFPYSHIDKITYLSNEYGILKAIDWVGGSNFVRKKYQFMIESRKETYLFHLEMDIAFRTAELISLFKFLYRSGINLYEKSMMGNLFFLQKSVTEVERRDQLHDLNDLPHDPVWK